MIMFCDISPQNSAGVWINLDYDMARTFSLLWFDLLSLQIFNLIGFATAAGDMVPAPEKVFHCPKAATHPVTWSPELNWIGNFFCLAPHIKLGNAKPLHWVKFPFLVGIEASLLLGSCRVLRSVRGVRHMILGLWRDTWFSPKIKFSGWGAQFSCHVQCSRHGKAMSRHFSRVARRGSKARTSGDERKWCTFPPILPFLCPSVMFRPQKTPTLLASTATKKMFIYLDEFFFFNHMLCLLNPTFLNTGSD
jgi:hypothetical protein